MKVKSESEVALLCLTLSDPMDCGPPGSSVHGIFQVKVLEWGAIAFSMLLVYRDVRDCCVLFFYPATSLNSLINVLSHSVMSDFL